MKLNQLLKLAKSLSYYIISAYLFIVTNLAIAESDPAIKNNMDIAFGAFHELQSYMVSENQFSSTKNEARILELLNTLTSSFKQAKQSESELKKHAGFDASLAVIAEKLDDTVSRFSAGKKNYALWRLRSVSQYCVSCHTTFKANQQFDARTSKIEKLSELEKAEFFLASRQFEKATPILYQQVESIKNPQVRMATMRKWLILQVRVYSDPTSALKKIRALRQKVKFTVYEQEELNDYADSLVRWEREGNLTVPALKKAENLIRQALGMNDPLLGKRGSVELIRATSMLHELLADSENGILQDERGHVLYLLGLSYSRLPLFFVSELPELYLEQCIREYRNTRSARECFRLYSNNIQTGFTGSSGTDIPKDVEEHMSELYEMAYGSSR